MSALLIGCWEKISCSGIFVHSLIGKIRQHAMCKQYMPSSMGLMGWRSWLEQVLSSSSRIGVGFDVVWMCSLTATTFNELVLAA